MQLNRSIRDYVKGANSLGDEKHWSSAPEVPKATELWNEARVGHDDPVEIDPNQVAGPYSSVDDYLERHYALLREDAVSISYLNIDLSKYFFLTSKPANCILDHLLYSSYFRNTPSRDLNASAIDDTY